MLRGDPLYKSYNNYPKVEHSKQNIKLYRSLARHLSLLWQVSKFAKQTYCWPYFFCKLSFRERGFLKSRMLLIKNVCSDKRKAVGFMSLKLEILQNFGLSVVLAQSFVHLCQPSRLYSCVSQLYSCASQMYSCASQMYICVSPVSFSQTFISASI